MGRSKSTVLSSRSGTSGGGGGGGGGSEQGGRGCALGVAIVSGRIESRNGGCGMLDLECEIHRIVLVECGMRGAGCGM